MNQRVFWTLGIVLIVIGLIFLFVPIMPGLIPIWIGIGMAFPKFRRAIAGKFASIFRRNK